jgi:GMP synthase-like glutamine amidotransferase
LTAPPLRIGLLECDHVDEHNRTFAGDYVDMFRALLVEPLPHAEIIPYDARNGVLPDSPRDCDAWLCSGSRHSVYEDLDWIGDLSAFVRDARHAGSPFVGICFGHQLIAHALGGRTERADLGWAAGAHRIDITRPAPWMDPPRSSAELLFMHQDQVRELPEGGEVLACTDHCQVAVLAVGDRMLGIQAHPEFGPRYVEALLDDRVGRIGAERTEAARRSLARPTDEAAVARWIARFLERS